LKDSVVENARRAEIGNADGEMVDKIQHGLKSYE